jgi:hypothetical protein
MASRRIAGCFPVSAKQAGSRGTESAARSVAKSFFLACDSLLAWSAFL